MPQSQRKFYVYCKSSDVNDATFRYIELIRRGLRASGRQDLGVGDSSSALAQADDVVTINCRMAIRALLTHPSAEIFHWFQGIEAVERRHLHGGLGGQLRYVLWSGMEQILLRRARMQFFVSEEMRTYFGAGNRPGIRAMVIPCYNADFDSNAWGSDDRYQKLDLVYAGSLYNWQRIDDVLGSYKVLKQHRPDATLTLFTHEVELARKLCSAASIQDVHISSKSPEQLVHALRSCSYGFILREHIEINRVSTPTKLSTYMAAGVIPVLTSATPALTRILGDSPYRVIVDSPRDHAGIALAIMEMAKQNFDASRVQRSYSSVFETAFSDSRYVRLIAELASTSRGQQ